MVGGGILDGMRVVEGSAFVAMPLGGMTLAQMGADVIRFDPIGGGLDYTRWPVTLDGRHSLFWAGLNKGKRSIAVDFRKPEGQELLSRLICATGEDAGLFITNFPARGWLDYETLRRGREDLIMVNLVGRRDGGSEVDYTVNPQTGLPFVTGPTAFPRPVNHLLPAWDCIAGQMAAAGLLAAERHRRRSGQGQLVRLALKDVALATLGHLGKIAEVDVGKNVCSLVGLDGSGRVVVRRRVRREALERFVDGLPRCIVAMEACCGAHHLGRIFGAQGHEVRLMSPEYVRPYVKAQKNDDRDAEAIAEAATRPTMRFVPVKSVAQSDVQALHRARERLVAERTALINHLRALLLERGITVPQGRGKLAAELCTFADEDDSRLSPRIRLLVEDLRREWRALDERIAAFDAEFVALAREDAAARRLMTIPGIGTINATALAAAVGDARTFARGRDMAAWLGLTPRQRTTGGKPRLLGISKRGNRYLRKNLIHGARAVLPLLADQETPLGRWTRALLARAPKTVVIVALANKLARIVWAVLAHGRAYEVKYATA